ncbi:sensor histidine kinase [Plantibacter flavus]|nr:histidine kinase [Plantibacter flavus]
MAALEGPRAWVDRHREPVITTVCAAMGLLFALLGIHVPWGTTVSEPPLLITLAFLTAILAVHLLRRRRPLTTLGVGVLIALAEALTTGGSGLGMLIVVSDLAYAAALYSRSRVMDVAAFACTALAVVSVGVFAVIWFTDDVEAVTRLGRGVVLGSLIIVPVILASSIWYGRMVRYPRLEAERQRERADTIAQAAAALRQDAVTRERLELSRELHDVIAGHLSAIAMQSAAALERRDGTDPVALRRSLALVRTSSLDALADMRTMIDVLRGDQSADDLAQAPDRLTAESVRRAVEVARANGLEVKVRAPDDAALAEVPAQTSIVGLRTLVEGLTNTAKHAPGASVRVEVSLPPGALSVTLSNPLPTATASSALAGSGGVGLVGLAERARLVGGDLVAGPDGPDWRTALTVPTPVSPATPAVVTAGGAS